MVLEKKIRMWQVYRWTDGQQAIRKAHLAKWFLIKRFFKISSMYFHYFLIIPPWKRAWPFIWFFLISSLFFSYFINYLPSEKDVAFYLIILESPLPKDALCWVWLKFAQRFWRRRWKRTDDRQQAIRKAHKLSAQVSKNSIKHLHNFPILKEPRPCAKNAVIVLCFLMNLV